MIHLHKDAPNALISSSFLSDTEPGTANTKTVVNALSDRVKWWVPMNEPQCFIMNGYMTGAHAPFKHRYLALPKLTKNCMLAFAKSVKTIRQYAKTPPKIGVAFASGAYMPQDETHEALETARKKSFETGLGLMSNRWWCDPILLGKPVCAYGVYRIGKKNGGEGKVRA